MRSLQKSECCLTDCLSRGRSAPRLMSLVWRRRRQAAAPGQLTAAASATASVRVAAVEWVSLRPVSAAWGHPTASVQPDICKMNSVKVQYCIITLHYLRASL